MLDTILVYVYYAAAPLWNGEEELFIEPPFAQERHGQTTPEVSGGAVCRSGLWPLPGGAGAAGHGQTPPENTVTQGCPQEGIHTCHRWVWPVLTPSVRCGNGGEE